MIRGDMRVPHHHAQGPPPAEILYGPQVCPTHYQATGERMPEPVPREAFKTARGPAQGPEYSLSASDGLGEELGCLPIGAVEDQLLGIVGALTSGAEVEEHPPYRGVHGDLSSPTVLGEPHGEAAAQHVHVGPREPHLFAPAQARIAAPRR